MNRAFKKYGKVRFSSIIPRRLRIKRALRTVRASQVSCVGAMMMQQVRASSGCKVKKEIALMNTIMNTNEAIAAAQRS